MDDEMAHTKRLKANADESIDLAAFEKKIKFVVLFGRILFYPLRLW